MEKIQIFNKPNFKKVRMVVIEGKPYAFGVDVAKNLGYVRPSKAVSDNCKGILKQDTIKNAGGYPEKLIPEGDIYRLIVKAADQSQSKKVKEKAEQFESWIFDEVLPEIRKTGSYSVKPKNEFDVLRAAIDEIEKAQKTANEAKQIAQNIKDTIIHTDEDWRNWVNETLNSIAFKEKNYREIRKQSYDILENRARCRLGVRLDNLKERLERAGATQTEINSANKLDVIESDTRLKEIYTSVVEKLAIKYLDRKPANVR